MKTQIRPWEMPLAIFCLVAVSGALGGLIAKGAVVMSVAFGIVWLVVVPISLKRIAEIKKARQQGDTA